ncbi:hypothetical protein IAQ61_000670 [Plenodomus lingam]|uniref:Similar to serum paraoxonase/arylesterase n=1 Tax=Leptosphaeria maculans (strain JN3 / isolate v23.1.3 / race Av1-4-5-6-7-8) TaxID=985895 RepID=E5A6H0_LEPMJ|nr:similar to serum paraoxonase/arylesterase [Plenodomus lingam JN3]KAH9880379.1 hypothetical protein IAQ61_000670 [Plenodomus lingam]CBX99215.1 similar to serum paraoxonase/arylesterase [Plenodomus lingam JN3]
MFGVAQIVYYATCVAWAAIFYQVYLKEFFATTLGFGRIVQSIDEFPYTCRRVEHPRLEACEDIWLDNEARTLYAACAGTKGRLAWSQAVGKLNVTGRRPGGSELIALDIDYPGHDNLFNMRAIKPVGYTGATGDGTLDLLGFDAQILDGDTIQFYFVNQRPPIGPFNNVIDASKIGANSTIEVFEMRRSEDQMRHLRTIWSPDQVHTPNRVAALGDGAFLVTNDHSVRSGWRILLDPIIGGGNVAYCDGNGQCHDAFSRDEKMANLAPSAPHNQAKFNTWMSAYLAKIEHLMPKLKLKFPNGLARGFDGLFYLPSTVDGQIRVLALKDDKTLQQIDTIRVGMPLDNVSPDAKGDLYVPGFPNLQSVKGFGDPYGQPAPATIWRIRKTVDANADGVRSVDYRIEKVIEDKDSKVIAGATTVRHDARTGRLFIAAAVYPFLVVCEPHSS